MYVERRAVELLRQLKFETEVEQRAGRHLSADLLGVRKEFGSPRRYGFAFRRHIDEREAEYLFRNVDRYRIPFLERKRPEFVIEDFWIIADTANDDVMTKYSEHPYRVFTLSVLEEMVCSANRPVGRRANTRIGRAVLANQVQIAATAGALEALLDEKVASLRRELPNSREAIKQRDASIEEHLRLKAQVRDLAEVVAQFKKSEVKEKDVVETVKTLGKGLQAWWATHHERICDSTYSVGLFTTAMTLCSLAGVQGKTVAVIAGALAGGKPLVDVLKSFGKKLFS
jgi:hypothetical protein